MKKITTLFWQALLPFVFAVQATARCSFYNFNSDWKVQIGDPPNASAPAFGDATWKPVREVVKISSAFLYPALVAPNPQRGIQDISPIHFKPTDSRFFLFVWMFKQSSPKKWHPIPFSTSGEGGRRPDEVGRGLPISVEAI